MKPFLNPLLFVLCILLPVFGYAVAAPGEEGGGTLDTWVLTLCLLGVIINGTLGVARALTARPSVQSFGWAVGFLVLGSVVWVLVSGGGSAAGVSAQERAALHRQAEAWKAGDLSAYVPDENGDSLLTLAAGLGRADVVEAVLADAASAGSEHAPELVRAAHRAAERNRDAVLRQLLAAGVSADARQEGMTLLHTAALNKARRAAACLLEHGASTHATTADGSTPLHHAVLAEDEAMARLLMQHGANPAQADADGRDAASYARSEQIIEALQASPASPAAAETPAP